MKPTRPVWKRTSSVVGSAWLLAALLAVSPPLRSRIPPERHRVSFERPSERDAVSQRRSRRQVRRRPHRSLHEPARPPAESARTPVRQRSRQPSPASQQVPSEQAQWRSSSSLSLITLGLRPQPPSAGDRNKTGRRGCEGSGVEQPGDPVLRSIHLPLTTRRGVAHVRWSSPDWRTWRTSGERSLETALECGKRTSSL